MNSESSPRRWRVPLYVRVLIGVAAGILFGVIFHTGPIFPGLRNDDLGQLGFLVIRLLKALAVPLILFAILDAFLRVQIKARSGARLLLICLCNVSVAFAIGLTLMNVIRPGDQWRGRLNEIAGLVEHETGLTSGSNAERPAATLDPLKNIAGYVPENLIEPFAKNNVITVVLLGLLGGAALRRVKNRSASFAAVEHVVAAIYQTIVQMLAWVVQAIPFAVFGVVAQVVGRSGVTVFHALGGFLIRHPPRARAAQPHLLPARGLVRRRETAARLSRRRRGCHPDRPFLQ